MENMIDKSLCARRTGRFPSLSRHRGFSLVEILMSIVLIAIGTTLALPSYRDMVEKRQVTNGAEQLASFINAAQGAAMKTNDEVWVSWTRSGATEWCIGANVESACDCTTDNACTINGQDFVLDDSHASPQIVMEPIAGGGGDSTYAFDPIRGLMSDLNDSMAVELRSKSGDFRLSLMVNSTGRVILCSPDADYAVPGYALCPVQAVELEEAG
jgi:type IV fimbrial biogenesis protein FimT